MTALRFNPDGRRLVVGHPDTTMSVWDAAVVERDRVGKWAGRAEDALWSALGSHKPVVGLAAVHALTADPESVRLMTNRVRRLLTTDPAPLIAQLGDDEFGVRENATARLAEIGIRAEAGLRYAAANSPSPEVRQQAPRLLVGFSRPGHELGSGHRLAVRTVEVAERVGKPAARELLGVWAQDDRNGLIKAEAREALVRLAVTR